MLKNRKLIALLIVALAATFTTQSVLAQEDTSKPIEFATSDAVIIGLGVAGGLTVAFLGKSEASKKASAAKVAFEFNAAKFARPVIVAVLTSIPIAIAASMEFEVLTLFNMFLVYGATLGMAELSGRVKHVGNAT